MSAPTPVAEAHEAEFVLSWQLDSEGRLNGWLESTNIGSRVIRLVGKPQVAPLGVDGALLSAEFCVTLEMRTPGYVDLAPGARARAFVCWSGWAGPPCSGRFRVTWAPDKSVDVAALGDQQPIHPGPPTNLTSVWWEKFGPAEVISGLP